MQSIKESTNVYWSVPCTLHKGKGRLSTSFTETKEIINPQVSVINISKGINIPIALTGVYYYKDYTVSYVYKNESLPNSVVNVNVTKLSGEYLYDVDVTLDIPNLAEPELDVQVSIGYELENEDE